MSHVTVTTDSYLFNKVLCFQHKAIALLLLFSLPLQSQSAENELELGMSGLTIKEKNPTKKRLVILVIEDQKTIQRSLENKFENYIRTKKTDLMGKYDFLFTETGEEGVNMYTKHQPHLVFIDHNLKTKMTGKDIVEDLRQNPSPTAYLIAFSNCPTNNRNMGADFELPKLTDNGLFEKALQQGLENFCAN